MLNDDALKGEEPNLGDLPGDLEGELLFVCFFFLLKICKFF